MTASSELYYDLIAGMFEEDFDSKQLYGTLTALTALHAAIGPGNLAIPQHPRGNTRQIVHSLKDQLELPMAELNNAMSNYKNLKQPPVPPYPAMPVQVNYHPVDIRSVMYTLQWAQRYYGDGRVYQLCVVTEDQNEQYYVNLFEFPPRTSASHAICLFRAITVVDQLGQHKEVWTGFVPRGHVFIDQALFTTQHGGTMAVETTRQPTAPGPQANSSSMLGETKSKSPTPIRKRKYVKRFAGMTVIPETFNGYDRLSARDILYGEDVPSNYLYGKILMRINCEFSCTEINKQINKKRIEEDQKILVGNTTVKRIGLYFKKQAELPDGTTDIDKYKRLAEEFDQIRYKDKGSKMAEIRRSGAGIAPRRIYSK